MSDSLRIARLRTGTVYKLVLVGLLCGFFPLFVLLGVLGTLDLATLAWNGQPITGLKAVFIGPLMGILFACALTAVIGSVIALGLWLFGTFRPLTVEFLPATEGVEPE